MQRADPARRFPASAMTLLLIIGFLRITALLCGGAGNQESECPCISRNVRRLDFIFDLSRLIRHDAVVQKIPQRSRF